jgi:RimJ/RimL family protein N-acetyltransferase
VEFIVNKNITLKNFKLELAQEFYEAIHLNTNITDPHRTNLQKKYVSLETVRNQLIDAIDNKFKIDGTPDFFIYYKGSLAGVFEFHPLSEEDHIEVGFWLFSEYRRLGIVPSVFPRMIDYGKENFDKSKILATTATDNIASQKLLEKSNFKKTGRELEFKNESGGISKEFEYIFEIKKNQTDY